MNVPNRYYKNFQYHAFHERTTDTTKIIINILIDNRTGYANIAEIRQPGTLTEAEIEFLAMDKIHEIERRS